MVKKKNNDSFLIVCDQGFFWDVESELKRKTALGMM